MFLKEFEIRWSDVDANRHLANSAYINFMSHTRMDYLMSIGFGHLEMAKAQLGPVIFHEHMYYFQEIFPGRPIQVSLQLNGMSEDGMFFEFLHNFYDVKGRNMARCTTMGAWIDLNERKLISLPNELFNKLDVVPKTENFKILTKDDTRKFQQIPKNLN